MNMNVLYINIVYVNLVTFEVGVVGVRGDALHGAQDHVHRLLDVLGEHFQYLTHRHLCVQTLLYCRKNFKIVKISKLSVF